MGQSKKKKPMCYLNTELSEIGPHTETCSPHTRTTAYSANKSICTYISSNGYPIGWAGGIRNCTAAVQEQKEHCLQTSMHLHVHAATPHCAASAYHTPSTVRELWTVHSRFEKNSISCLLRCSHPTRNETFLFDSLVHTTTTTIELQGRSNSCSKKHKA